MIKFNSDNILAGYIKQLLADFNLPMCKVYSRENAMYKEKEGKESPEIIKSIIDENPKDKSWPANMRFINYIKDNQIQQYVHKENGERDLSYWKPIKSYYFNKKIVNQTKKLKIKNNIYDSYTHEYLGNYLRFYRDYFDINLMPLYNCFSNVICSNLLLDYEDLKNKFSFNSFDSNYKIYMIPVKLFKDYTIAIDCDSEIELCCCIYGKYLDKGKDNNFNAISGNTYSKIGCTKFNQPFLYTKLNELNDFLTVENINELARREGDLKLLIKLPANNRSSITVLEGNYLRWNDSLTKFEDIKIGSSDNYYSVLRVFKNHTTTNFEDFDEIFKKAKGGFISADKFAETRTFKPITELQLLKYNTHESYPFSNRLIEYLLGNVITSEDQIGDNIQRTQEVVAMRSQVSDTLDSGEQSGLWDARLRPELYYRMQNLVGSKSKAKIIVDDKEIEIDSTNDTIMKNSRIMLEKNHDILGYVDKDVEVMYSGVKDNTEYTIANIDIYPDIYRDDK